ncbi:Eco57I restriction-modification methylase domain-containing protein [uncultured Thiodictyon sp.]|uniref:Eco57I restriction-modification methylase domain-containing protein n=1 Tax=uncultured Thiodictyon sp. TaxID=1846217 RepID=UPI0025D8A1EF|nr:Eco57I restriction-modification methylase domain-containing protein [uncultured Thiodictyon sp.]
MITAIEQARRQVASGTTAKKKALLGQFFTPASTAEFMAGLFPDARGGTCHLLDAGAGIGSLSCAFLERCLSGRLDFNHVQLTAFECDEAIRPELDRSLSRYRDKLGFSYEVVGGDFIESAVNRMQFGQHGFTHAILNPPYKKISSNSRHRLLLRQAGIETVNLYSAFVALALLLMAPGGQLVAIIPRSFCNGPYYRPFRNLLLERAAIRHLHLFESRTQAFKDDDVLQENIIIRLELGAPQGQVTISTSTDDRFADLCRHDYAFDRIVRADDPQRFIHIPTAPGTGTSEWAPAIGCSLADLGISVSTGPVVDFRLKEHLRDSPGPGTVPLLYPGHFSRGGVVWPKVDLKKPNAIRRNGDTEKWLYPNGFYCVVRRFSSKEENRRIVASVVDPAAFSDAPMLGFENHLNLFHEHKQSLTAALAHGLAVFLNTTAVDECFRRFSGHTQVNATDLKQMKYPSRAELIEMGDEQLRVLRT